MRFLVLAICVLILQHSQLALAHAKPQAQSPTANAVLSEVKEIRLQFSERLEPAFSTLNVFSEDGKKLVLEKPKIDDKTMVVVLPLNLAKGRYTVKWSVVSVDGHRTKSSYQFSLK